MYVRTGTKIVSSRDALTFSLESTKRWPFLHQVMPAGGLEPEVVQTKSYFLPADSGWFAPIIFTSNGLTENDLIQSYLILVE